jgi:hypothetical protein
VAGCGEDLGSGEVQVTGAVVGGTSTTARPEVGAFVGVTVTGGIHNCTATLIGPREILTASHCIADQDKPTSPWTVANYQRKSPSSENFQVDSSLPCSMPCPPGYVCDVLNNVCAQNFPVERVIPLGLQSGVADLAVDRLVGTSPVPPASIATGEPSNTNLTDVGYGCVVNGGQDYGVRRCKTYFYNGASSFNYCQGDSGGPTFLGNLFDFGPIVRVVSTVNPDGGADPTVYRAHLLAMVNAMESTNLSYRAQIQGIGFQAPMSNGATAGTTGQSLRLEALQIWSDAPGVVPAYRAYIQSSGWQGSLNQQCPSNLCANGMCAAGTTGRSLRIEAVSIQAL